MIFSSVLHKITKGLLLAIVLLICSSSKKEKVSQMRYDAPAIERLGMPEYNWWNECLHGVARAGEATVFPQAIGMGATFNSDLMFNVGTAIYKKFNHKLII